MGARVILFVHWPWPSDWLEPWPNQSQSLFTIIFGTGLYKQKILSWGAMFYLSKFHSDLTLSGIRYYSMHRLYTYHAMTSLWIMLERYNYKSQYKLVLISQHFVRLHLSSACLSLSLSFSQHDGMATWHALSLFRQRAGLKRELNGHYGSVHRGALPHVHYYSHWRQLRSRMQQSPVLTALKEQCVSFRALYWQNMAEIEFNNQKNGQTKHWL